MEIGMRFLRGVLVAAALCAPSASFAQCSGLFGGGEVCGNPNAGSGLAARTTQGAIFDRAFGSTPGTGIYRGAGGWASGAINLADTAAQKFLTAATVGQANPARYAASVGVTGVMGCPGSGWDTQVNYSGDGSYSVKETVASSVFNTSRTATSCIFYNPSNLALVDDTDWILYATNPSFASKNQLVLNGSSSSLTPTVAAQRVTAVTVSPDLSGYSASQTVGWVAYMSGSAYAQGTVQATAGGVINTAQFAGATGLPTAAIFTSTPTVLVQPPNMAGGTAVLDVVNFKMSRQPPDVYPAPNSYLYNILMEGYSGTAGVKGPFVEYVGMAGIVGDPTVGSEDGIWDFRRMVAGTRRHLYLGGGFYEPGVTTDKGVGSSNLSTSYWLADVNSQTRSGSTWIFNATTNDKVQFLSGDISASFNSGGIALDLTDSTSPTLMRVGASSASLGQVALCGNTLGCGTLTPTASPNGAVWTLGTASGTLVSSLPAPLTVSATTGAGAWTGLTSGGVLYASSTTTIASSGLLAANAIVTGGGAGATPQTTDCTLVLANLTCVTSVASSPLVIMTNSTNDNGGHIYRVRKDRAGADVQASDTVFNFLGQMFANTAYRNAAQMLMVVDGAPSGSNVPTNWQFATSNTAGLLNQVLKFNSSAHVAVTQASAPTVSSCGTSPAITSGSTDMGGEVTVGTATPTACTITFGTAWAVAPKCVVGSNPQLAAFSWVSGTGTLVITQTATSSNKIVWQCGHAGV